MTKRNEVNDGPKDEWTNQSLEDMAPATRAKAEAWLKALDAAKEAKKVFEDYASASARKAKVIGPNQYLVYNRAKWGNGMSYLTKDVGSEPKASKAKPAGPKF